jgi:hypothetical protein
MNAAYRQSSANARISSNPQISGGNSAKSLKKQGLKANPNIGEPDISNFLRSSF